ncbi:unnamed protein product [Ectocarpus fasciculatus]
MSYGYPASGRSKPQQAAIEAVLSSRTKAAKSQKLAVERPFLLVKPVTLGQHSSQLRISSTTFFCPCISPPPISHLYPNETKKASSARSRSLHRSHHGENHRLCVHKPFVFLPT